MKQFDKSYIRQIAEAEIREEEFRKAVDACKKRLKERKWYHRLFPYKLVFVRVDEN